MPDTMLDRVQTTEVVFPSADGDADDGGAGGTGVGGAHGGRRAGGGGDAGGGGVWLAGTLTVPAGGGPHPGIAMVGGSGPSDRDNDVLFPPIRERLVAAGLAVLSYDKRGVGGSSGAWLESGVTELAADAVGAVEFLRERPEVDANSIGLFGHSEGGWVVLRAAAGRDDVAWVVTNSGPGVGTALQERYGMAMAVRGTGESETVVDSCVALFDQVVAAARRDAGFAEVDELLRANEDFTRLGQFGEALDEPTWRFMKRYVDHHPAPDLARLRCPHLALFGAADPVVPVADSIAAFAASACDPARADTGDLTVEVFAGANHRVRVDDGTRFAPGYLDTLTTWITRHLTTQQRRPSA